MASPFGCVRIQRHLSGTDIKMIRTKSRSAISLSLLLLFSFLLADPLIKGYPPKTAQPVVHDFFPLSVWYGGGKARAPMVEHDPGKSRAAWRADLQQIKSLGFNAVRCWIEWTSSEPVEGKLDFSAANQLCDLAAEIGLKVIVQVYVDSAPEWVGVKFPDSRFVAQSGAVIPSQAAPGFCFDHPGVRDATLRFLSATAEQLKNKKAFYAWDLWSEPHIINWAVIQYVPNAQFCYCQSSIARFRRWLEMRYGLLEKLNVAWYRTFSAWNQVEPPRFGTILSYTDLIDWKEFIAVKLAEDLALRAQHVRRVDPTHVTTSHAAVPAIFTSPFNGDGTPDDWKMAQTVNYYGTSIYPKHASSTAPWPLLRRSLAFDFIRSMTQHNDGFYIGELQAGFGTTGTRISEPVTADDLRNWMWSAIAAGARAINLYAFYPMSSGYESGGYGLVDLDGTLTDRARAAGDVARLVSRHQQLFLKSRPTRAEVAILYNPLAHMVGGEQSVAARTTLRDSLIGYYRALYEANIPVDFVHAEELPSGKLKDYKLLVVPYPVMMAQPTARAIAHFVRDGGAVFAEARLAWNDDRGYAAPTIPGFGLHEVFGVRESQVRPAERAQVVLKQPGGLSSLVDSGLTLEGSVFEESLRPISDRAKVLGVFADGSPALVESSYGQGKTIIAGTFLGLAHTQRETRTNALLFRALIPWAGVVSPFRVTTAPTDAFVEVRALESETHQLLFVFSRSAQSVEANIELASSLPPIEITEITTETRIAFQYEDRLIKLHRTLSAYQILVFKLTRAWPGSVYSPAALGTGPRPVHNMH